MLTRSTYLSTKTWAFVLKIRVTVFFLYNKIQNRNLSNLIKIYTYYYYNLSILYVNRSSFL